ncbi:cytochrome P450 2K1-like isoform X1 [Thalassophryne amazonica]|uniref:cytochrome P450 2K1-like isoform X1 n=1 Tax=Thalassophryne amazonica TaxID=390379 RepID=UPI0014710AB6|nr:cytochrome P450 2K1-like isoform X1 [Thalassophryne amazonica]
MALFEDYFSFIDLCPTTVLLTTTFLLFLCLAYSSFASHTGNEPPGPRRLPLLGNLLQIDLKRPHNTLCEFSKKYGSVFTVYFGPTKVVVLAGYKTVKEALVNYSEEFGDRMIATIFDDVHEGHGIVFANGDSWKEMRRFGLSSLKECGMGGKGAEKMIIEECHHLIEMIKNYKGEAFDIKWPMNYASSNIICSIMFGSRFDYNDPVFKETVWVSTDNLKHVGTAEIQLYNMFPWLGSLISKRKVVLQNVEKILATMNSSIQNLKATFNADECRGLVDCFLTRQQKDEESHVVGSHYHEKNFTFTVTNLFAAGSDTTAITLRWALLFMVKYPHIQDQVHEELSRVIGNRQVSGDDRKLLPYTNAVIHETQRFADILPIALPHQTASDVTFQGYLIKKGTTVFPLLTSVLFDKNEWESPHTFNPSRFLDEEGKFIKRNAFMPFSAGQRVCLGVSLARMELFLFFSSLLQHFKFSPPPGVTEDEVDLTPSVGFTVGPSPYELCATMRM